MTTQTATATRYASYQIIVRTSDVPKLGFSTVMILDEHDCLACNQLSLIIATVRAMKGWCNSPDIMIDDTARVIELMY